MSSENNNVWQLPEPEVKPFPEEEHLMYSTETSEQDPFPKRWKPSSSGTTTQLRFNSNELPIPQYQYNTLDEPSPLGLRLRKSPSLLELAQKRLNQVNIEKGNSSMEDLEARTRRDSRDRSKAQASSSPDKLKASHFPALLLRIGHWEYVSKHEGDLVAKCYFSKHKLVWEVLDNGLKKKLEISWADIFAINANYEAGGLGTLTIVLNKPPLFFKEINPQPRKHTQWRATSDFTNGEANINRQHFLQCAQGVLDKHFEKLIQCDARLNILSQQPGIVLDFPYFPPRPSINYQDIPATNIFNFPEIDTIPHMASSTNVGSSSLGLIHQEMSREVYSSSSGMSMDIDGQNPNDMFENISQMLLSDNNVAGDSDEETLTSRINSLCGFLQDYQGGQQDGNVFFAPDPNLIPQQDLNDFSTFDPNLIPQQYGNDYSTFDPNMFMQQFENDESTLDPNLIMQQYINDGSVLDPDLILQKDMNDGSTFDPNLIPMQGQYDGSTLGANWIPETMTREDGSSSMNAKLPQEYPNAQQDGNDGSTPENNSGSNEELGISRTDSFSELVQQLPRITSLPRFLFELSENGEILK
ncbi:unnamed protein product [Lactuca saligna]|uniref:TRF2/HOY1 PH-like domain-containing protein n=1 Tax=Lactuca saligna TaxID=75948 RepID=A0AA36EEQ1_LACSI|nr:unnamed protein product [Lactuca saligna]